MKNVAFFCIPAFGHTNPMLPVAHELIRRGNRVRFYSFDEFGDRITASGAEFVSCSRFLPELDEKQKNGIMKVSTTEMTVQDIRITLAMGKFLECEMKSFRPDIIYTDSVCFWGKLTAWKYGIPMVVSTSTFAFNQLSSQYLKNSPGETADMIFGLPRVSRELKKIKKYGYHVKSVMSLVQSGNDTDTVVYTSQRFQPYAGSFSDHYKFTGPSVFTDSAPCKSKERPLIYISMGTVINDRPDFYTKCIEGLKDLDANLVISCGSYINMESFGKLPENVSVYPNVDQLGILSKADAFITHCGMNSVSESLYMSTPMVLYPQTAEEHAVARRAEMFGAGVILENDSACGIRDAVKMILNNRCYSEAAGECCSDFRSCPGPSGAAEFIENSPHTVPRSEKADSFNKKNAIFQILYWLAFTAFAVLYGSFASPRYLWAMGLAAGLINTFIGRYVQKRIAAELDYFGGYMHE